MSMKPVIALALVPSLAFLATCLVLRPARGDPFDGGRTDFGIFVGAAEPQGELRRSLRDEGLTILIDGGYRLRRGPIAVGAQLEITSYAHETRTVPLSDQIPDVHVKVDTNHGIYGLHLWLRAQPRVGPVRPYVMALVGGHQMETSTSVWGKDEDTEPIASSSDMHDATWSAGAAAGVQFRLMGERTASNPEFGSGEWNVGLLLDLRMIYLAGGRARYLPPGGIRTVDGERVLDARSSRTDLTMIAAGIVLTFGHASPEPAAVE